MADVAEEMPGNIVFSIPPGVTKVCKMGKSIPITARSIVNTIPVTTLDFVISPLFQHTTNVSIAI
jgi:hypothetical protein